MARKVTQLLAQSSLFATNWGTLGNSLPCKSKSFPNFSMVESTNGVEVSCTKPGCATFVVPYPNVISYEVVPEAAPEAPKAAVIKGKA